MRRDGAARDDEFVSSPYGFVPGRDNLPHWPYPDLGLNLSLDLGIDGPRTVGSPAAEGEARPRSAFPELAHADLPPQPLTHWHPVLAPLAEHLDDPSVTDLCINGAAGLWVDRGAGLERDRLWQADESAVHDLAIALVALGGRHLDELTPCVDVRLDFGARVHAVLPPISVHGPLVSMRIPRVGRARLDDLHARGMFDHDDRIVETLRHAVRERTNILISGAAGSGKTTLLAALLAEASSTERIITIEDVAELRLDHPHHVALEARQANLEGAGAFGLSQLVREALRMRPDRLVVGECRGEELRDLLTALNTGHDGGAGTLHASGLEEVPARLSALGALARLEGAALAQQAAGAIGLVLHVERERSGLRRLACAGRLALTDDGLLAIREERLT